MTSSLTKSVQPAASPTAAKAVQDERAFAVWSEAVKQQMLVALQKRQQPD